MIRTSPDGAGIDPYEFQASLERGNDGRPWVMSNFVTTIDGAAVVQGGSSAINDEDDMEMFIAMRSVSDFVVVGAGTALAEDYRPMRSYRGRPAPRLVIVSGRLSLDPAQRVFSDAENRVTVLTGEAADEERAEALSEVADVVKLRDLSAQGVHHYLRMAKTILIEGGPSLFGQFVASRLVDEVAWTVAPIAAAGESPRMAHGPSADPPLEMRLDQILYGDRSIFFRYLRA